MKKTIYLADDEPNIRELIKLYLAKDGFEVTTFATGDELLAAFLTKPCDMVILDIMMPGMDGLSVCTKLRDKSNVLIIIVSARDSEIDRITGITLGSDDYLTKPFSPMELVARVKALFRRLDLDKSENTSNILSFGHVEINIATRSAKVLNNPIEFSPTEFALMVYLIQNSSRAVSREELLKNVWLFDFDVDTRATDDVVKRLRKKLTAAGSGLEIECIWGYGFRLISTISSKE